MLIKKIMIILQALLFLSAVYFFPLLPDRIPTHWNAQGIVDGYGPKYMIFLFSLMPIMIYGLLGILPKIDPKKEAYTKHNKAYQTVRIALSVFMAGIYIVTALAALDYPSKVDMLVKLGVGILFIIMGNVLSQARQNYMFGIRTPWTLANEEVWRKTHRVGAYVFVILGIVMCISAFFTGTVSAVIIFIAIMAAVIIPFVYSYLEYRKITRS